MYKGQGNSSLAQKWAWDI